MLTSYFAVTSKNFQSSCVAEATTHELPKKCYKFSKHQKITWTQTNRIRKKYRHHRKFINKRQWAVRKFALVICQFTKQYSSHSDLLDYPQLLAVYNCCQALDIYLRITHFHNNMSASSTTTAMASKRSGNKQVTSTDDCTVKKSKAIDNEVPSTSASSSIAAQQPAVEIKRGQKGYKTVDNTRLMMMPESREEANEKDLSKLLLTFC